MFLKVKLQWNVEDGEVVRVVVPKFLDKEKENEYHAVETDRRAKL